MERGEQVGFLFIYIHKVLYVAMLGADPAQVKKKKFLSESRSGLGRLTKKAHYMFRKINLFFLME